MYIAIPGTKAIDINKVQVIAKDKSIELIFPCNGILRNQEGDLCLFNRRTIEKEVSPLPAGFKNLVLMLGQYLRSTGGYAEKTARGELIIRFNSCGVFPIRNHRNLRQHIRRNAWFYLSIGHNRECEQNILLLRQIEKKFSSAEVKTDELNNNLRYIAQKYSIQFGRENPSQEMIKATREAIELTRNQKGKAH